MKPLTAPGGGGGAVLDVVRTLAGHRVADADHTSSVWLAVMSVSWPTRCPELEVHFVDFRPDLNRHDPCDAVGPMALLPPGAERRQSPRIDVVRRVKGKLVALDTEIIIHDLSRTGFAVVSELTFDEGQLLDFRLSTSGAPDVTISAEAVHSRPLPPSTHLFLTGFRFLAGKMTGKVPQSRIDRLIEAVIDSNVQFFAMVGK